MEHPITRTTCVRATTSIDNLSEEARKGQQEKAEQGIWPTKTPLGYLNVTGPDGRKVIAVDPEVAPIVSKLFEWYADGQYSLKEVAKKARAAGLAYKKSGAPVPTSTVHSILRNRLYTGLFEWNGKLYQGKHEPLVSVEMWERVQGAMNGRNASKHRRMTHDFAFSGLIACAKCGCSVVGEIKKQKYIYYHCTGYADKCRGEPASCRRKYVREEVLEQHFTALLGQLRFDDEVLEWMGEALHASHADERREREEAIKRLRAEYDRLQARIDAMYIDKLDGRIGGDFFDKMAGQWRDEQTRCLRDIERHQEAEQSYMDEGVRILELVRDAQSLFERQPAREKRRLLNFVLSNCTWEDGEVVATFRQPFDLLAETNAAVARSKAGNGGNSSKNEIWLPSCSATAAMTCSTKRFASGISAAVTSTPLSRRFAMKATLRARRSSLAMSNTAPARFASASARTNSGRSARFPLSTSTNSAATSPRPSTCAATAARCASSPRPLWPQRSVDTRR